MGRVRMQAKRELEQTATEGEQNIELTMPRRTGRAAASWGHFNPSLMLASNPDLNADDAVWEEEGDLSILQGTNVGYVETLNGGTSQHAPAGFLDFATTSMQFILRRRIIRMWGRA